MDRSPEPLPSPRWSVTAGRWTARNVRPYSSWTTRRAVRESTERPTPRSRLCGATRWGAIGVDDDDGSDSRRRRSARARGSPSTRIGIRAAARPQAFAHWPRTPTNTHCLRAAPAAGPPAGARDVHARTPRQPLRFLARGVHPRDPTGAAHHGAAPPAIAMAAGSLLECAADAIACAARAHLRLRS